MISVRQALLEAGTVLLMVGLMLAYLLAGLCKPMGEIKIPSGWHAKEK